MTLTVYPPDDVEQAIRERALRDGRSFEDHVLLLIERDAAGPDRVRGFEASRLLQGQADALADSGFETLLDELTFGPGLSPLPADFSRADIYADHD